MNAHEAEAAAEQAVSKVEAAMTAAEEAAKEADAPEVARARAYAEEASKTLKGKKNLQSGDEREKRRSSVCVLMIFHLETLFSCKAVNLRC
ncbi:hypothetical protein Bca4012_024422 [Brassica carinata]